MYSKLTLMVIELRPHVVKILSIRTSIQLQLIHVVCVFDSKML